MRDAPAPRQGRWIAKPRKPRWALQVAGWSTLGFQFAYSIPTMLRGTSCAWIGWIVLVLFTALALAPWLIDLTARRKTARDAALMDGGFGDQFPVEVTVVVGSRRIGTDRGAMWFADGLMGFSGEASSFVLAPGDVAPQWFGVKRHPREAQLPANAVVLRGAPKTAYLLVTPLLGHGRAYSRRLKEFARGRGKSEDERLREYVFRDETATAERQWPPLEPYAEPLAVRA